MKRTQSPSTGEFIKCGIPTGIGQGRKQWHNDASYHRRSCKTWCKEPGAKKSHIIHFIYINVQKRQMHRGGKLTRLPWWLSCKATACNSGDLGSVPGLARSTGGGKATHSSICTRSIPWTEEPGDCSPLGRTVGYAWEQQQRGNSSLGGRCTQGPFCGNGNLDLGDDYTTQTVSQNDWIAHLEPEEFMPCKLYLNKAVVEKGKNLLLNSIYSNMGLLQCVPKLKLIFSNTNGRSLINYIKNHHHNKTPAPGWGCGGLHRCPFWSRKKQKKSECLSDHACQNLPQQRRNNKRQK